MKISAKTRIVLQSFIICTAFFAVILGVIGTGWEANDDPAFAWLLSRPENSWSPFQGVLLGKAIHVLYGFIPRIEWWLATTVSAIYVSSIAIIYTIRRSFSRQKASFLSLIVIVLIWFMSVRTMNFTRTAAILSTAGVLLIANGIFVKKLKKGIGEYCIGIVLLLWGREVRNDCAFLATLFLAIIGLVYIIRLRVKERIFEKRNICRYAQFILIPVLVIGMSVFNSFFLTTEQKEYMEYNKVRSEIQDYSKRFEWDERYEEIGISKREFQLFLSWFQEDTEEYELEKLEAVLQFANNSISIDDVWVLLKKAILPDWEFSAIVICLLVCLMVWNHLRNVFELVLPLFVLIGLSLYLILSGRFPERVYESVMFMMICVSMYVSRGKRNDISSPVMVRTKVEGIIKRGCYVLPSFVMIIAVAVFFGAMSEEILTNETYFSSIEEKKIKREGTLDIIDRDSESIYLIPVGYAPASLNDDFGIWEARPEDYCDNYFYLGGWDAAHPYFRKLQKELGITNPVKALFEKDNVYSVYCGYLVEYIQEHYGEDISVSCVKEYNNNSIVKYTQYVDATTFALNEEMNISLGILESRMKNNINSIYVEGVLQGDLSDIDYLYCNIRNDTMAKTFQLNIKEDGSFNAYLYENPKDVDLNGSEISFWGKGDISFRVESDI